MFGTKLFSLIGLSWLLAVSARAASPSYGSFNVNDFFASTAQGVSLIPPRCVETLTGTTPTVMWTNCYGKEWTLTGNSTPTVSAIVTPSTVSLRFLIAQTSTNTYTIDPLTNTIRWQGTSWQNLPAGSTNTVILVWNGASGLITGYWVEQPLPLSGVIAGSYGDSTHVATFTVQTNGLLTAAATSATALQPAFTTGAGVTNVSNVLSANIAAGSNVTLTTNSNGQVSIAASTSSSSTISGVIFTQTSSVTVTNTTVETTLLGTVTGSKTLAAGFLTQGKNIAFRISGYASSAASGQGNMTVNVKLGSTTVLTTGAVAIPASLSSKFFIISGDITCRTTGASGTVFAQGRLEWADASGVVEQAQGMVSTTTSTIDTTVTEAFDTTWTFSAAAAGNTVTCSNAKADAQLSGTQYGYVPLGNPRSWDGTGALGTIPTASSAASLSLQATYSASAATNGNYVYYIIPVPGDFDTSEDPVLFLATSTLAADVNTVTYTIGMFNPAQDAARAAVQTGGSNYITSSNAAAASAANTIDYRTITLTGWGAAITSSRILEIIVARVGGDSSTQQTTTFSGSFKYKKVL